MPDTTSGLPSWPGVSEFEVARLLRRGRARGSLTLDEVIDVVRDAELTSELIAGIRSSIAASAAKRSGAKRKRSQAHARTKHS